MADSAFSGNGQYFANLSSDGRLKLWECESGTTKQEYILPSHLSAVCTCLVWAPIKQTEQGASQKKKKRKSQGSEGVGSDVVALGTASGTILLYSVNRCELVLTLTGEHTEKIYSLCWNNNGTSLFSAAADRKVVEWDPVKGEKKSQWKIDKGPVYRLGMLQDNKTLVTAGRSIQCWNVETKNVVATFPGHINNINHLAMVTLPGDKSGYFLSAAEGDRSISAWRFTEGVKNGKALASFALQDDPSSFSVSRPVAEEDPIVLVAVTVTGILHIFEHQLNGRCAKPLQPKVKLHIGSDCVGAAKPLPVLAAFPFNDSDGHCLFAYGSLVKPGFEKMNYRSQEEMVYVIRRDPLALDHSKSEVSAMKTKTPVVPNDVKTLVPEHMVSSAAASAEAAQTRKRRTLNSESENSAKDSLPIEQRLSALNIDRTADTIAPPQADNLIHLLRQGLKSPAILKSVLDRADPKIINNTVRCIPVKEVLPLITELTTFMQYRGHPNHSYALWLRSVLENHAGYLTSCPDLVSYLTPLLALMSARTTLFPKVSQLRGRLHLMLGELEHRTDKNESSTGTQLPAEALLVYQEESSDEASEEGDWPLQSGSESEDQWDELSDIGESMDVTEQDKEDDSELEIYDDQVEVEDDDSSVVENGVSD